GVSNSPLKLADSLERHPEAIGQLLMGQAGLRPQLLDRFAERFVKWRSRGGPAAGRQGCKAAFPPESSVVNRYNVSRRRRGQDAIPGTFLDRAIMELSIATVPLSMLNVLTCNDPGRLRAGDRPPGRDQAWWAIEASANNSDRGGAPASANDQGSAPRSFWLT